MSAWLVAVVGATLALVLPARPAAARNTAGDDVAMVEVPAGAFVMGSADSDADPDEQPVARILVDTFRLDKIEVTNLRYLRCMEAGGARCPSAATRRSEPGPSTR
jgi:formylglycine-generating enzyme required for sulfatase activity